MPKTSVDALLAAALALPAADRRRLAEALLAAPAPIPPAVSSALPPRAAFGVDGCKRGWVALWRDTDGLDAAVVPRFADILALAPPSAIIAVDVPIGLFSNGASGGRPCDRIARKQLGPRASSVFPPPCRSALAAFRSGLDYEAVSLANREAGGGGLSRQAFGILAKIAEVDDLIDAELQTRVIEVHPEVCFATANDNRPLASYKKDADGSRERIDLLARHGLPVAPLLERRSKLGRVANDDIVDAAIALWTAERFASGTAHRIGDADLDARGLRMEMWC